MKPKKIHFIDEHIPQCSIHYICRLPVGQLTDDPSKVTCGTCRRMMKRDIERGK